MMRKFSKRSTVIAAACAAVAILGGGVAYAFWTAGGAGTGTAETGTSADITIVQTTVVTPMGPGIAAQPLEGNFNNSNEGPVYVTSVTANIDSVTQAVDAVGPCSATDYTLTDEVMTVGAEVTAGDAQGSWSGATIAFANDPATNQDGCKGATVELAYTSS
jgi:hypothetical protein